MLDPLLFLAPVGGLIGLAAAFGLHKRSGGAIGSQEQTLLDMGATARGLAQWTLGLLGAVFVALLMLYFAGLAPAALAPAVLAGGMSSAALNALSAALASQARDRVREHLETDIPQATHTALRAGAVVGLTVSAVCLLLVSLAFILMSGLFRTLSLSQASANMLGFGLGVSLQALLHHLGGGVVGRASRLAGSSDPAAGEVAASVAEHSDSYILTLFAAIALAVAAASSLAPTDGHAQMKAATLPLALGGLGLLASVTALMLSSRETSDISPGKGIGSASLLTCGLFGLGSGALCYLLLGGLTWPQFGWMGPWMSLLVGQLLGLALLKSGSVSAQSTASAQDQLLEASRNPFPVSPTLLGLACWVPLSYGLSGGFSDASLGRFGLALGALGLLSTLAVNTTCSVLVCILFDATQDRSKEAVTELRAQACALWATNQRFSIASAALAGLCLLAAYGEQLKTQLMAATAHVAEITVWAQHDIDQVAAREMSVSDLMTWYDATVLNPWLLLGVLGGVCAALSVAKRTVQETAKEALTRTQPRLESPPPELALEESSRRAGLRLLAPLGWLVLMPLLLISLLGPVAGMGLVLGGWATGLTLALLFAGARWSHDGSAVRDGELHSPLQEAASSVLGVAVKLPAVVAHVAACLTVRLAPAVAKALGLF